MKSIIDILKTLPRSPGPWVDRKGVLWAAVLGSLLFIFFVTFGCVPDTQLRFFNIPVPINLVLLTVLIFLLVALRFLFLQGYLHSGAPVKIGLAYDGEIVRLKDWNRTTKVLRDLFSSGQIKQKVSLRFVPSHIVARPNIADKFMKRYKFDILTTAKHSSPITKNQNSFAYTLHIDNSIKQEFAKTSFDSIVDTINKRPVAKNLYDLLDTQAETLHDAMLFLVAAHYFLKQDFESASQILRHVDGSLAKIIPLNDAPRFNVRCLDMHCCLARTHFLIRDMPPIEECRHIRDFAERALIYVDTFPDVAMCLARIRFLTGDIKGAIQITELALKKIQDGALPTGSPQNDKLRAIFLLDKGFLSFSQTHWSTAANSFSSMLAIPAYKKIDWSDLVDFIDHVAAFEPEGIVFLQALYRKIAGFSVGQVLRKDVQDWLTQDDSRKELANLLKKLSALKKRQNKHQRKQKRKRKHKKR